MIWAVAIALGAVLAAGAWLMLTRDVFRALIGVALIGNGVNLLVFAAGRLGSALPAVIPADGALPGPVANPLPQALVLTAIVIGFALLCFSLVLAIRLMHAAGSDDVAALRAAEPPAGDAPQPPIEERP